MSCKVSVVMAVHNGGQFFEQAVQSILSQTFMDFEFVIVDDASTDGTVQMIRSLQDPRIVAELLTSNIGQTAALNRGIAKAKGQYIARMDADDIALPGRLAAQVEFLDQNPAVGVVGTWQQTMDSHGQPQGERHFPCDHATIKALLVTASPLNWFCLSHPTVMIRKSVLIDAGLYDEQYRICQDYDLWIRISRRAELANIPMIGLNYRAHKNSLSQTDLTKTKAEISRIIQSNILFHLKDSPPQVHEALRRLLIFDPQQGPAQELDIWFDLFFSRHMGAVLKNPGADKVQGVRDRLLAAYTFQWLKTELKRPCVVLWKIFLRRPRAVFCKRFFTCLWWALTNKW